MSESLTQQLEIYGVPATLDRPRERIFVWAAGLQEALVAAGAAEDAVDYMMQNDTRRYLFMLEGIFRLYRKRYGHPIEKQLIVTKAFEDQLGAVDYAICMREHGQDLDLPKKVRRWLKDQLAGARKATAKLVKKRWLPKSDGSSKGIAKMLRSVTAVDWDDYEQDHRQLRSELERRLRKVHEANYDMTDLEQGVHELRRQLRWLPIYLTALEGFARLDAGLVPVPELEPLLRDPIATNPFAQLAVHAGEPSPVPLSQSIYLANTKMIAELGDLKDEAQLLDAIAGAFFASGAVAKRKKARNKALAVLEKTPADEERIFERCAEIYAEVKRTGMLGHLADSFAPESSGG